MEIPSIKSKLPTSDALEFKDIDEIYDILSNIYQELGNYELSKDLSNKNTISL